MTALAVAPTTALPGVPDPGWVVFPVDTDRTYPEIKALRVAAEATYGRPCFAAIRNRRWYIVDTAGLERLPRRTSRSI